MNYEGDRPGDHQSDSRVFSVCPPDSSGPCPTTGHTVTTSDASALHRRFFADEYLSASLASRPSTTGHIILDVTNGTPLFSLDVRAFAQTMLSVRHVASIIRRFTAVVRCALVTEGSNKISVLPLHGLEQEWSALCDGSKEYHAYYPGYISSKDGPQMDRTTLEQLGDSIRKRSGISLPFDTTFHGDSSDGNLFAKIVRGELPQTRIWEDESHVAFLTPFGNTPGFTVLVPRRHLPSDVFSLDDNDFVNIAIAAHSVAQVLIDAFALVRCGMIFEGFEIDYTHVKLIPIHESRSAERKLGTFPGPIEIPFNHRYTGSVTSLPGPTPSNEQDILRMASKLRNMVAQTSSRPV